jgi:hypothetical protein
MSFTAGSKEFGRPRGRWLQQKRRFDRIGWGGNGSRVGRFFGILTLISFVVHNGEAGVGLVDSVLNITEAVAVLGSQPEDVNSGSTQSCDCGHEIHLIFIPPLS